MFKKLASETALYGLSTIASRLLNFFLVPIHTQAFSAEENGLNITLYSYIGIANIVFLYGMETAYFRYSKENEQKYFNIIQSAILVSSMILGIIIMGISTPITNFLNLPGKEPIILWVALLMMTDAIVAIPFARLRHQNKALKFVSIKFISILLNVLLNSFFLLYLKPAHEGSLIAPSWLKSVYSPEIGAGFIILANLIANLSLLFWLKGTWKNYTFTLNWAELKVLWRYGYPIMIMGLATTINLVLDRILLEKFLPENFYANLNSKEVVGIYGSALKLSVFMSLAIQAYKYSAEPFFLGNAENTKDKKNLSLATHWFLIICLVLWVGISTNLSWIKMLFLRQPIYWIGIAIVPISLLSNLFLGLYYTISVWFKLIDRTYFGSIITFVGLLSNLVGNILFIPILGFMACAYSYLFSTLLMTGLCYYFGEKYYPVPYKLGKGIGYLFLGLACIYLPGFLIKNLPEFVVGNMGFFVFLVVVFLLEIQWKNGRPFIPK